MALAAWIALAFLVVALVASAAVAVVRGLRLWRALSSFSAEAETALDVVMRETAEAEERAASLTAKQERLNRAIDHLKTSLAQLASAARRGRRGECHGQPNPQLRSEQVTRVGAIDLGTNATRLLVADVEDGRVEELVRRTRITRLGEGVDARRRLLPVPVARVRNVLADYRRELEDLGAERTLAVATSAVRDAENGEAFLGEVEWSYGFRTRLLSGDDEAAMTLRGVGPLEPGTVVIDVGGGSTELITEGFRRSMDIGSVRLTERHGADWDAAAAEIRDQLPALAGERILGVDGTTAELAALGSVTLEGIDRVLEWLRTSTDAERRRRLLQPDRSDVIAAGVLIVREVLLHLGLDRIEPSPRDLLNAVALEAAALPQPAEGGAPPGAYTCC